MNPFVSQEWGGRRTERRKGRSGCRGKGRTEGREREREGG